MNSEVESFIKDYKEHIEKQYDFIKDSSWYSEITLENREQRISRHDIVHKVVKSSIERLKYFVNISEEYKHEKKVSKFIELIVDVLREYVNQSKVYLNTEDWAIYGSLYEDKVDAHQAEEIDFQNKILENINKINVEVSKLNLEDLVKEVDIPIYGDKLAPLLMRTSFINRYPIIQKFIEQKGLKDVFK